MSSTRSAGCVWHWLIALAALMPAIAVADVTNVSVDLANQVIGQKSVYTVSFTLSTTVGNGGSFYVTFPSGTSLSALTNSDVQINNVTANLQKSVNTISGQGGLTLRVDKSGQSNNMRTNAGDLIQLIIGKSNANMVTNPSTQGTSYTVRVHTSAETNDVTSSAYSIIVADMTPATVTLSNHTAGQTSNYEFGFSTAYQLDAGQYIQIVFPTGTTLSTSGWSVNGTSATAAVSGTRVAVAVPNVLFPSDVTVSHTATAITNTSTPSSAHTVNIYTSTDVNGTVIRDSSTTSNKFTITSTTPPTVGTVTISPTTVTAVAQYTIGSSLAANAGLVRGDTLTYTFPSTTNVPGSMSSSAVSLTHDGGAVSIGSVITDPTARTVKLVLSGSMAGSGPDVATFSTSASIANPTSAASYTLTLKTTGQPTAGTSSSYSTTSSDTLTSANVVPNPNKFKTAAQYTIQFSVGASGQLAQNSGTITIAFPSGTDVPSSISTSNVTVNSVAAYAVSSTPSTRTVVVTTGTNVANNAAVTVVIAAAAGLKNPSTTGTYHLSLSTSSETARTSNAYSILQSQVTPATVTLASAQPVIESQYTVAFETGSGGALVSGSSSITIDFPDATGLSSSIAASDITVNGTLVTLSPTIDGTNKAITFTTPVNVSGGSAVDVVIASGVTNPSLGSYTLSVNTSVETTPVASASYTISSATAVTGTDAGLVNTAVNVASNDTVFFTTNNAILGKDNHSIYIDYPNEFNISTHTTTTVTYYANAQWNTLTIGTVARDLTAKIVQLPLGNGEGNAVPGGVPVRVILGGVTNPAQSRGNYIVKVHTTTDAYPVNCPYLAITSATGPLASVSATPSPTTANTIAAYTFGMTMAGDVQMTAGVDTFYVVFPSGTTLPSSISTTAITVNGADSYGVTVVAGTRTVKVTTPVAISPSSSVTLATSSAAGIRNPTATGSQTWNLRTSLQTTNVAATATISAVGNVSAANVTPAPTTVNTAAQYTLDFTMGDTALVSGNTISLTFPDNTSVPSTTTTCVHVQEGGLEQTLTSIASDPASRQVTITVGEAVAAAASMRLILHTGSGIVNPSTPGGGYTLSMSVTNNGSATSNVYEMTNSQVSAATVTPSPSTQNATGQHTISFAVGAGGALTGGLNTITITFPTGTTVPSFIPAATVTVNGTLVGLAPTISTRAVTITTPVNVAANGAVSVVFSTDAGIENPNIVSTGYTLTVATSKEPTAVSSLAYAITRGTDISAVHATLGTPTKNAVSAYSIGFTTGTAGLASGDTLFAVFPSGTTIPASIAASNVLVNDVAANAVLTTPASRLIRVKVGSTSVGASTATTLALNGTGAEGITNPATTGSNYTLTLRVGSLATAITSTRYSTTTTTALTSVTATPSPATTAAAASYTILGTTSSDGALAVGDTIVVTFPAGTTVPSSMAATAISVDGVTATAVPVINQSSRRVAVVIPTAISAWTQFTLVIGRSAGLANPTTAAGYTATGSTNIQTSGATSSSYTISVASTVSSAVVTPSPAMVNTVAQYGVRFSLGASSGLVSGNTITLTFPSGTTVPSTVSTSSASMTDDGVAMSAPSAVATNTTSRTVTITVANTVAASSVIDVTLASSAGITNPLTAGNTYTLTVAATNNGSATSNVYTITASSVSPASVSPSPSREHTAAEYTISFTVGAGGALSAGTSTITFTFPSGTTIPATMAANKVTVNGTALSTAPSCDAVNRTIQITTPVSVSASSAVSVVFASTAGVQNPGAGTNYSILARTSTEPWDVSSSAYVVVAAASISGVHVSLGDAQISVVSTYTLSFTTGTGGLANGDTVYAVFPVGTTVPATISAGTVTINSVASTQVITYPSTRQVRIISATSAAGTASVTVAFGNVTAEKMTNPSTSSTHYTLTARIGMNAPPVSSVIYTIAAPSTETLATATVTPTPGTASATAAYTMATTTGAHGALIVGDTITVVFPSAMTVPASIAASAITVNGTACLVSPVIHTDARTVHIPTPTAVGASASMTIAFSSAAGFVNPVAGTYALQALSTDIQPVSNGTPSSNYTINAGTSVTAAAVTVSPASVSANAQYTLALSIGSTGNLVQLVDKIRVAFPSGTTLPASISPSNATVNGANADAVTISGDTVKVTVGSTITASSSVTLVFKSAAGIVNPSSSGNYALSVSTTQEPTAVASSVYSVSVSTVSGGTVALSNGLVNQQSQYTISFTTGGGGALSSGSGTVSIKFPTGTGIGTAVARSSTTTPDITVNGSSASTVTVNGLTVTVTTPVSIGASSNATIVFASGSGMITNPGSASNTYQVSIETSSEVTSVSSSTYAVTTTTTVRNVTVSLSANGDGQTSTYTVGFRLGAGGALTTSDSLKITFPTGTGIASLVAADVSIKKNGGSGAAPAANPTVSGLDVRMIVPAATTFANNDSVTIIIGNGKLTNPSTTGSNKTLSVNTTEEPDPISSAAYTIISGTTALTQPMVNVNPNTISSAAAYTITFSTGAKGALRVGDTFTVTFPSGTTVPGTMNAANVRVNGSAVGVNPTCNSGARTVQVTTPVAVSASASVELVFLSGSGMLNPSSAGYASLSVVTNIELTPVTSVSYGISAGETGKLRVELGPSSPASRTVVVSSEAVGLQLKLIASETEDLTVSELKLKANGTGSDPADIDSAKVYLDANGNGHVDGDALLGHAVFSADDGTATIAMSASIAAGATRYWLLVYKLSSAGISGRTYYATVQDNTYLTVAGVTSGSPIAGDSLVVAAAPITGATLTMKAATVTASGVDISPVIVAAGAENVGMLKLILTADSANALVQSIRVNNTRTGGGVFNELDVDSVKIFRDSGDGDFSATTDTFWGAAAVTGASGGSGTVTFTANQTIGTSATVLFVAYDISSGASGYRNLAAQVLNASYVSLVSPGVMSSANFPVETTSETTLPVELVSFVAHEVPAGVELLWTTESESENLGWRIFRVELADAADTTALAAEARQDNARPARLASATMVAFLAGQGSKPSATQYRYIDAAGTPGATYAYYLVDVDYYGNEALHGPAFTAVSGPREYRLGANYPNPFNPATTIEFDLPGESRVRLAVYSALGQEVAVLHDGVLQAGYHRAAWNGTDNSGRQMGSGIYLYRLSAVSTDGQRTFVDTQRMVMVR